MVPCLHGGSLEITLTVPFQIFLISQIFSMLNIIIFGSNFNAWQGRIFCLQTISIKSMPTKKNFKPYFVVLT